MKMPLKRASFAIAIIILISCLFPFSANVVKAAQNEENDPTIGLPSEFFSAMHTDSFDLGRFEINNSHDDVAAPRLTEIHSISFVNRNVVVDFDFNETGSGIDTIFFIFIKAQFIILGVIALSLISFSPFSANFQLSGKWHWPRSMT